MLFNFIIDLSDMAATTNLGSDGDGDKCRVLAPLTGNNGSVASNDGFDTGDSEFSDR